MFDLNEQLQPVSRILQGTDSTTTTNRIKIISDGVDLLNQSVPNGKKWQIVITVRIEESEA